mmetsp:Transcript_24321/g.27030  ORF Transcript_24321/g.27030 Transcript_24321/m.27030 type:complete len:186 (-) Transcript_24321:518-1075(-)
MTTILTHKILADLVRQTAALHDPKDSLSRKLSNRPAVEDLVTSYICMGVNVAPSLQATQRAIKFQQTAIYVSARLTHRPPKHTLCAMNILKEECCPPHEVAHSIARMQQALKFAIVNLKVQRLLQMRMPLETAVVSTETIKRDDNTKDNNARQKLSQKLGSRPSLERLKRDHPNVLEPAPIISCV